MTGPAAEVPVSARVVRRGIDGSVERAHLANVLGGLAVGISDAQAATLRDATGLDLSAVSALTTLLDRPGATIEALARVVGLTHSGTVRLADRLGTQGLLVRTVGPDARAAPLRLTESGERLARSALAARRQALQHLLGALTDEQHGQLLDLAHSLATGLVHDRDHARRVCRHCEHSRCRGSACPVGAAAGDD